MRCTQLPGTLLAWAGTWAHAAPGASQSSCGAGSGLGALLQGAAPLPLTWLMAAPSLQRGIRTTPAAAYDDMDDFMRLKRRGSRSRAQHQDSHAASRAHQLHMEGVVFERLRGAGGSGGSSSTNNSGRFSRPVRHSNSGGSRQAAAEAGAYHAAQAHSTERGWDVGRSNPRRRASRQWRRRWRSRPYSAEWWDEELSRPPRRHSTSNGRSRSVASGWGSPGGSRHAEGSDTDEELFADAAWAQWVRQHLGTPPQADAGHQHQRAWYAHHWEAPWWERQAHDHPRGRQPNSRPGSEHASSQQQQQQQQQQEEERVRHPPDVIAHLAALGLGPGTQLCARALKAAFHKCAMQWHPDRQQALLAGAPGTGESSGQAAADKFRAARVAFDALRAIC